MLNVTETIHINRPVEDVWAYTTDVERFPEWAAMVHEAHLTSPGPLAAGSALRTTVQFLGRQFSSDQVITEYEPDHRMVSKTTSGPLPFTITTTAEPAADSGTTYVWSIEGEARGFFSIADPLLAQLGKRQIRTQLETLRDLLEASAVTK